MGSFFVEQKLLSAIMELGLLLISSEGTSIIYYFRHNGGNEEAGQDPTSQPTKELQRQPQTRKNEKLPHPSIHHAVVCAAFSPGMEWPSITRQPDGVFC